jgi:uncharacterized membrane protein
MEELLIGLMLLLVLVCLAAGPVLGLVALVLTVKLRRRLEALERSRRPAAEDSTPAAGPIAGEPIAGEPIEAERVEPRAETPAPPRSPAPQQQTGPQPSFSWEMFFGRQALGWVAVVLLLFGAAFFLRYAFENNWIGPMGQVSLGVIAAIALLGYGWWCDRLRNWRVFSQVVTAAGLLLLYLTTFAAFGYYTILTRDTGGLFLVLITAGGALLGALYNARAVALLTVIGGVIVPLLMHSPHDRYQQLFVYLGVLNAGVLVTTWWRRWPSVGLVALIGTQAMFWLWYADSYHPEKLPWAIGFQAVLFLLFLGHSAHVVQLRRAGVLDLICLALTAAAGFGAAYVLLEEGYRPWLGTLAVAMAAVYAGWARLTLWRRPDDPRQTLLALAVAVGFAAAALPIQADAHWVALGWAAEAAALWWFGLRIRPGYPLRGMAAVLAVLSVGRVLLIDTPWHTREPFLPLINTYALPSLGVAACLIGSVLVAFGRPERVHHVELVFVRIAGLVGVLLVWTILSVETYGYFDAYAALAEPPAADGDRWRWLGQMALSALWAVYASAILAIGFWMDRALLRWTALALYAVTIVKVFVYDMADLAELYRIGAFLVVAVILGVAAWAYQRFTPKTLLAGAGGE